MILKIQDTLTAFLFSFIQVSSGNPHFQFNRNFWDDCFAVFIVVFSTTVATILTSYFRRIIDRNKGKKL